MGFSADATDIEMADIITHKLTIYIQIQIVNSFKRLIIHPLFFNRPPYAPRLTRHNMVCMFRVNGNYIRPASSEMRFHY